MPFVNPFTTQNTSPSSSGASNTGFVNPFRGYTPPQAPTVATKPVQTPQASVPFAGMNIPSGVFNNPVANFIGGIGEKIAEIAPKIPEAHFADNTNFFTPKGFVEQTAQGIANTPQEALKGSVDLGSNIAAGTSTPQQVVGDIASAAQLPLLLLSGGLLSGLKSAAGQTIKNIGEIGLKGALTQGAKETAISLSEQGIKGIAKTAAKEAVGGGAFGLLSGAQSGRNITDPMEYIKNMLQNVGIGAVTGAAFSIPPLVALPLARGLSAKEGAIFIKNAHGEPQIDHILISPEVAQHTVIANNLEKEPAGKAILKESVAAQSSNQHVSITPTENGKIELPGGNKVDIGLAAPYDPSSFSPDKNLESQNNNIQQVYKDVPPAKIDSIITDTTNEIKSVTDSLPTQLKDPELLDKTMATVEDAVRNVKLLDNTQYPEVNKLINYMLDKVDSQTGIDTKQLREDIMNTHEQVKTSSEAQNNPEGVNNPENSNNQATESSASTISQPQEPTNGSTEGNTVQGNAVASEQAGSGQPEGSSPSVSTTSTNPNSEPSSESTTTSTDQNSSGVLKPVGEGKEKVSRLAARVTDSLDKTPQEIKDQLGATYNEMNKKANIDAASKFVSENPDKVIPILEGKEQPPEGVLKNSIYVAAEQASHDDIALGRQLASLGATRAGQELSILTEINKDSPVNYMRQLASAREKAIEDRTHQSVTAATQDTIKQITSKVKDISKSDVAGFVRSIQC